MESLFFGLFKAVLHYKIKVRVSTKFAKIVDFFRSQAAPAAATKDR